MEKIARPTVGIYDERTLQRQMLHHNLERMPYEVLYSCSDTGEFLQNYLIHPVEIILYNAEGGIAEADDMLKQLDSSRKKVTILFYYGVGNERQVQFFKSSYDIELLLCKGTWEDIIISLDQIYPAGQKELNTSPEVTLAPGNPFYNIASNKTCVRILELLREGKNIKQISAVTGTPGPTINYYLKKMRQETGCTSVVELVIDAKETGVL
jgi:DNA-binding CsgD family transcriptional regulator